eukprot:m.180094 g.180094  ORF g.180094 m.180094 type:complete len:383 (+) comp39237_c0_seq38:187-1335(+)
MRATVAENCVSCMQAERLCSILLRIAAAVAFSVLFCKVELMKRDIAELTRLVNGKHVKCSGNELTEGGSRRVGLSEAEPKADLGSVPPQLAKIKDDGEKIGGRTEDDWNDAKDTLAPAEFPQAQSHVIMNATKNLNGRVRRQACDCLPGQKGQKGDNGRHGSTGKKGETGPRGTPGTTGVSGKPGMGGKAGLPGEPGQTGARGEKGRTGKKGEGGAPGLCKGNVQRMNQFNQDLHNPLTKTKNGIPLVWDNHQHQNQNTSTLPVIVKRPHGYKALRGGIHLLECQVTYYAQPNTASVKLELQAIASGQTRRLSASIQSHENSTAIKSCYGDLWCDHQKTITAHYLGHLKEGELAQATLSDFANDEVLILLDPIETFYEIATF